MGLMAMIADVLDFVRREEDDGHVTDVKADPGDGDNFTAQHSAAPGDDSAPLLGDQLVAVPLDGGRRFVVVGYIDTANEPQAAKGERRLYSRDASGAVQGVVWIKSDGKIEASGSSVHLGDATGAAKIARDDHVQTELTRLKSELDAVKADLDAHKSAFDEHGHPAIPSGGGPVLPPVSPFPATTASPQDPGETACEKVHGT